MEFNDLINRIADEEGLPRERLRSFVTVESAGNPKAQSGAGAKGLMQMLDSTFAQYSDGDIFDPETNLRAGVKHIKYLDKKFDNDPVLVAAAYNAGEGNVQKYGGVPPFEETQNYVRKLGLVDGPVVGKTQQKRIDREGVAAGVGAAMLAPLTPEEAARAGGSESAAVRDTVDYELERTDVLAEQQANVSRTDLFAQAFADNLTSGLAEMLKPNEVDPMFTTQTPEIQERLKASPVYGDKDAYTRVVNAANAEDFDARLEEEEKRIDVMSRAARNAEGFMDQSALFAISAAGALADPAMLVMGMGIGAVARAGAVGVRTVMTVEAASGLRAVTTVEAASGIGLRTAMAAEAAGNVALGAATAGANDREYGVGQALLDATLGAGITGLGYAAARGLQPAVPTQQTVTDLSTKPQTLPSAASLEATTPAPLAAEVPVQQEAADILAQVQARASHTRLTAQPDVAAPSPVAQAAPEPTAAPAAPEAVVPEELAPVVKELPTVEPDVNAIKQVRRQARDVAEGRDPKAVKLTTVKAVGNTPPRISGYVQGLVNLLGLKNDIQVLPVSAVRDAALVASLKLSPRSAASLSSMKSGGRIVMTDGRVVIAYDDKLSPAMQAELLSHEVGHLVEWTALKAAPPQVRVGLRMEYNRWKKQHATSDLGTVVKSLRAPVGAEYTLSNLGDRAYGEVPDKAYWLGFSEWFADNTAKWAVTSEVPRSIIDQFFSRVAAKFKEMWNAIKGTPAGPAKGVEDFLNKLARGNTEASLDLGDMMADLITEVDPESLKLSIRADRLRQDVKGASEVVTLGREQLNERVRTYLGERKTLKGTREALDAMGTTVALSKSKAVRVLGSRIMEDPTGAVTQRGETAAMYAMKIKNSLIAQYGPTLRNSIVKAMDSSQMAAAILTGADKHDVLNKAVKLEMALRRDAAKTGAQYVPVDAKAAGVADILDAAGNEVIMNASASGAKLANMIRNLPGKTKGYMENAWSRAELSRLKSEEPEKYNAYLANFQQQYVDDLIRPAQDALLAKGPVKEESVDKLFEQIEERARVLVSNKLDGIMSDKGGFDYERISFTAQDILEDLQKNGLGGAKLSDAFQKNLAEVLADRSRKEMDLSREINGVRLVDLIDFDVESAFHSMIHKHSGQSALARIAGVKDELDVDVMMSVIREDAGSSLKDNEVIRTAVHMLGYPDASMPARAEWVDAAMAITSSNLLGKRVLPTLADMLSVVMHNGGLLGAVRTLKGAFTPESDLYKQVAKWDLDLVGQGWKVDTLNSVTTVDGINRQAHTATRVAKNAARLNTLVSFHRTVNQMLRKGAVNVAMADILGVISSGAKATAAEAARLADLGISPVDAEAIRNAWPMISRYSEGGAIPMAPRGKPLSPNDLPVELAEKLQTALIRRIDKAIPQTRTIGELPLVALKGGDAVQVLMQYQQNMIASTDKLWINGTVGLRDSHAMMAYLMTIPVGLAIYQLRVQLNTAGMSAEKKADYEERANTGLSLVMGVANTVNTLGYLPVGVNAIDLLFGGTNQGVNTPAPVLGYYDKLTSAAGVAGSLLTDTIGLTDNGTTASQAIGKGLKALPLGTTIPATYLTNALLAD